MSITKRILAWLAAMPIILGLTQCAIVDDIPFPFIEAAITAIEVEGQCDALGTGVAAAAIDNEAHSVLLYVDDTVDITRLRIKRLEVSNNATIDVKETPCLNPEAFPEKSFSAATGDNTRVDFTGVVKFTLHTYQDYVWTVTVQQIVNRKVSLDGQVGEAVIDPYNENVVVYIGSKHDLRTVHVNEFTIGGPHGTVSPDPSQEESYDFTTYREFDVTYGWSPEVHRWKVFVYQTDEIISTTAEVFPRTVSAIVSGQMQNGTTPMVEYRQKGSSEWNIVPAYQVTTNTTNYTAEITGLAPVTEYECRATAGTSTSDVVVFTTATAQQLENASFDEWHTTGSGTQTLFLPWKEGDQCYWDTGNRGATTVGASNSTGITEGGRTYANLQSKYIVIKFAAGNIFTGEYLATDGTNGILGFGRPFSSFPTKLQFDYKYKTSTITRTGGAWNNAYGNYISKSTYENLKGKNDSCQIYIALLDDYLDEADRELNTYKDVAYPYLIRTRPSTLHLFDPSSKRVIAYAQLTQGNDVSEWTTEQITLNYRYADRVPKYILVVASSSKYGDYFSGGEQSLLQLDNLQLLYE